ncbi:MAG TPA: methyltransferase domain-containing protein [Vicinamibacterales bacterium]|nr:methyltransferase domain-containing protein [Vicinamibacterales bacterium]
MVIDTWDPQQYDKFERQREQPFYDLLTLVKPQAALRIVDLGCGTGKLTRVMHERLQAAETVGIDRSESMLASARTDGETPGLRFEAGTIEAFADRRLEGDRRPGLIFSNAALHWVGDHDALLQKLTAMLAAAGQLAFQVPAQHDDATHTTAAALAASEPYAAALGGWRKPQPVLTVERYARLLYQYGFRDPIARLIVYPHVLESRDAVVDWVKGTTLTDYARHLAPAVFDRFLEDYRERLLPQLDPSRPFFFPFKRILCWGQLA